MSTPASLSVLVVEDNTDGAETLAVLLGIYGYSVRATYDGQAALREARESTPDVVLLDIGLPGMDGCTVAEQLIRTLPRRPLLVAVTGYTNLREQCRAAGIDHYFVKPVEPAVLHALLGAHAAKLADVRPTISPA
jgi:CheY-like chemotaxis protein